MPEGLIVGMENSKPAASTLSKAFFYSEGTRIKSKTDHPSDNALLQGRRLNGGIRPGSLSEQAMRCFGMWENSIAARSSYRRDNVNKSKCGFRSQNDQLWACGSAPPSSASALTYRHFMLRFPSSSRIPKLHGCKRWLQWHSRKAASWISYDIFSALPKSVRGANETSNIPKGYSRSNQTQSVVFFGESDSKVLAPNHCTNTQLRLLLNTTRSSLSLRVHGCP